MKLREVTLVVPEDRLEDLYRLAGTWLAEASGAAPRTDDRAGEAAPAARPSRTRSSRYGPIAGLLEGEGATVRLDFDRIEEAIGGPLPESARRHRAWWANTEKNAQARGWLERGYRVTDVDLDAGVATLERA